jgi:hypothetical protein
LRRLLPLLLLVLRKSMKRRWRSVHHRWVPMLLLVVVMMMILPHVVPDLGMVVSNELEGNSSVGSVLEDDGNRKEWWRG